MATTTAAPSLTFLRRKTAHGARRAVSRRRWSLAGTLEISLAPSLAQRHTLNFWPRIPYANREAMAEPMEEIIGLLRDPAAEIPEEALSSILGLATHPASPAFGPYPIQARFAAYSLADELRTPAAVEVP
ncbi:MAG TPA: hypothetical protein VFD90_12425 [Gaiellales bacterium]|jgi:hypothetical protein|nr:hypothetical protein [Gaiellales bacterium]